MKRITQLQLPIKWKSKLAMQVDQAARAVLAATLDPLPVVLFEICLFCVFYGFFFVVKLNAFLVNQAVSFANLICTNTDSDSGSSSGNESDAGRSPKT